MIQSFGDLRSYFEREENSIFDKIRFLTNVEKIAKDDPRYFDGHLRSYFSKKAHKKDEFCVLRSHKDARLFDRFFPSFLFGFEIHGWKKLKNELELLSTSSYLSRVSSLHLNSIEYHTDAMNSFLANEDLKITNFSSTNSVNNINDLNSLLKTLSRNKSSQISRFNCSGIDFTQGGALSSLCIYNFISSISLRNCNNFSNAFFEFASKNKLTSFSFVNSGVLDKGVLSLSRQEGFSNIKKLDLSNNKISTEGVVFICNSRNTNLKQLDLSYNFIDSEGFRMILESDSLRNLVSLNLGGNEVECFNPQDLPLNSLVELGLDGLGLTDSDVLSLSKQDGFLNVEKLDLSNNKISTEGVLFLCDSGNTNLKQLDLSYNFIDSEGFRMILESDSLRNLVSLNLGDNEVKTSMFSIKDMDICFPNLLELNLWGVDFDIDSYSIFTDKSRFGNLMMLSIDDFVAPFEPSDLNVDVSGVSDIEYTQKIILDDELNVYWPLVFG